MKRFLILAAVVAGLSVTGLSGAAMAGYGPARGGYGSYGMHGGFGGYNSYNSRNCWGGYRNNHVPMSHCSPRPYGYGSYYGGYGSNYGYGGYGSNYGGYGSFGGRGCNW